MTLNYQKDLKKVNKTLDDQISSQPISDNEDLCSKPVIIKGLDGYRAFAFFAVFLVHLNLLPCGYLGVYAFFVLSGFLITPILLYTKNNNTLSSYLKVFYGRRVLRIFPLYYLYLFTLIIVISIFNTQSGYYRDFLKQVPYALTYTYDFLHATKYYTANNFVTHFWSLAVEEQFYLVWPFIIFFIKQKNLKKFLLCFVPLGMLVRFITFYLPTIPQFNFLTSSDVLVYVSPFSHIDAFVIGAFFSVYSSKIKVNMLIISAVSMAIIVLGIITSKITTGNFQLSALGYSPYMSDSAKYVWGYTAFALFFSYILLGIKKGLFFSKIFENHVLAYLGKISYGLYIFHFPIIYLCRMYISNNIIVLLISSLLLTIVVSALSFELFEKKINKLKDKIFNYK